MQQLWAEVRGLYVAGESWYLTAEEQAKVDEENLNFQTPDVFEELINEKYHWDIDQKITWIFKTADQILEDLGYEQRGDRERKRVIAALRDRRGLTMKKIQGRYGFYLPFKDL